MISIYTQGKNGVVNGKLTAKVFEAASNMPGKRRWKDGELIFELSAANIEYLRNALPEAQWLDAEPLKRVQEINEAEARTIAQKQLPPEAFRFEYKSKPYRHQEVGFFLARDRLFFGFFCEMGTGKTKMLIDTAAYKYSLGEIDTLLITAPNGVHRQWIEEQLPLHMPDWVPYKALAYRSPSKRTKAWEHQAKEVLACNSTHLRIITMHYEAFATKAGKEFAERVLMTGATKWDLDESTRIKTHNAQRTKAVLKLAPLAKCRGIASGAPITQGIEDLYSQLAFLHPDILGFNSFYSFRNFYCHTRPIPNAPYGAVQVTGYKNLEQLKHSLDGHTYRVTKADCLTLPEKIYMNRFVPLTPEQAKLYKQMKDDLITQLSNGTIVDAPSAIVQLMKLQQIICGFIIDETGKKHFLPNDRIQAAIDAVQEAQNKVIVWARFHADLHQLGEAFKKHEINFVEYSGRVAQKQRDENLDNFKADQGIKVFLAQQQSGGTGLNLAVADTAIYYSNDFNADTRWQSEDRIHRIGQRNNATYIDLISPGTIDTKILAALRKKKNVADNLLDVKELLTEALLP